VISVLLAVAIPALNAARSSAKSLVCSSNLKTVALEFGLFADGNSSSGRGDSEALGAGCFRMDDFQESLYGLDEFWDRGSATSGPLEGKSELLLCPSGASSLTKRKGMPCSSAAIGPAEEVSMAANMRLRRAVVNFKGKNVLSPVATTFVRPDILRHPYVPIMMDVDGHEAQKRGYEPFYTAPPIAEAEDAFANGKYWIPGSRHASRTNVAFVGGHVLTSRDPAAERWDWSYQADVGR
jgi:prepilin-type processing-associated H-X9-DG protein